MKKFIIILILSSCTLGSCKKFLETQPEDSATIENYFNTEADLNRALNGVYNRLIDNFGRMYSRGLFTFLSLSDESFYKNISISNLKVMDFDAANLEVGKLWEVLYQGIDRANLLLENVNKPKMDDTRRGYIKGEALFLRAYYYFVLVDNFGGVPLKLKSTPPYTEQYLPRSSVADVYAKIVTDMKEAENLVSDYATGNYSYNERVTKTAVQGILARVYLTMAGQPLNDISKYADALIYANKVIASGSHALNADYKQIFINHSQDLYDIKECIWEVGMYGNKQGNVDQAGFVGIENGLECLNDTIGYSTGSIKITAKLFNTFAATDLRRDWCIAPYKYTTAGGLTTKTNYTTAQIYDRTAGKWRREYETLKPKNRTYNSTNFPLLRYSDILLMKAEAENEVNGGPNNAAYDAINMVRRRGYGKPIATPDATVDLSGLGKAAFFAQIQNERFKEFCFEGMRKHDLLRWGIYVSTMNAVGNDISTNAPSAFKYGGNAGKNTTARNILFPIPNTEFTINKLIVQNPGW